MFKFVQYAQIVAASENKYQNIFNENQKLKKKI